MKIWILYAVLSMVFAGVTSVIAKFGMKNVSGDASLAVRTSAVFILIWLNAFAFKHIQQLKDLTKSDRIFMFFRFNYYPVLAILL